MADAPNIDPTKTTVETEKALQNYLKMKFAIDDIAEGVNDIVDHTKKLNDLTETSLSKNKILSKLAKDKIELLNKEFFTTENLYKSHKREQDLSKQIQQTTISQNKLATDLFSTQSQISEAQVDTYSSMLLENDLVSRVNKEYGLQLTSIDEVYSLNKEMQKSIKDQQMMLDVEQKTQEAITKELEKQNKIKFLQNLGTALQKMKEGPIDLITQALGAWGPLFKAITDILFDQNKQVTEIQRTLMLSGNDAREIRDRFVQIEGSTLGIGSGFTTVKNMLEASNELATSFGAAIDFSQGKSADMVKDQIALTKELGLSGQEAGSLQTQMSIVGMNEKQMGEMAAKSNIEAKTRLGVTFSLKAIMSDISKMSAATFLSLSKNPEALSDAVVQAKALGVSLDKMNGIADGLLNIESSLGAQFEASVLTGKNLNFELAREMALQNDIAGATKQILSQVGSAADFAHMNRIQQEAIAKSVGMNRDELAGSLMVQENLNKLGGIARKQMEEKLAGMDSEQQKKFMLGVTDDKAAYAAAKRIDAQTRLNAMWEKLVSVITNFIAPLEPLIDMLVTAFEAITVILAPIIEGFRIVGVVINAISDGWNKFTSYISETMPILATVGKVLGTITAAVIAIAAAMAFTSMAGIPFVGPILAAAAAIGAISFLTSAVTSVKDAQIGPDGGLMVSGAKGTYQLDKNDSVIAGTSLDGKATNGGSNNVDMSGVIKAIQDLQVDVRNMKTALIIDGREFGRLVKETTSQKVARA